MMGGRCPYHATQKDDHVADDVDDDDDGDDEDDDGDDGVYGNIQSKWDDGTVGAHIMALVHSCWALNDHFEPSPAK